VPYIGADTVDLVRELLREVQCLRVEVRQLNRGHADADTADLVQAVHAAFLNTVFTAAELLARSLRSDAPGTRLAALLAGRKVRSVGKLLASVADKHVEGLVLRRVGTAAAGALWCVSETHKPML
jgi:hypothetical protein